jgi:hypothetical protein
MTKIHLYIVIMCITGVALSGCGSPANRRPQNPPDPAEVALADSFQRIAVAFEELAKTDSARAQNDYRAQSYSYDTMNLPVKWLQKVELLEDYHGDLVGFIQMLSMMSDMKPPRIIRSQRGQPIVISITKGSRQLIAFMADIGHQADGKATVKPVVQLDQILVEFKQ